MAQSPPRGWGGTSLTRRSTLTDTRPPCFEVKKHALRLEASALYLPTNLGPSPLRAALDDDQEGVPPTDDFGGPFGKGMLSATALYTGRVKLGRSSSLV